MNGIQGIKLRSGTYGIAAGYSGSVRRTLEAVLEGLAEAERERGPSAASE